MWSGTQGGLGMKKIEITEKQKEQFNSMLFALRQISKQYQTPEQLRRNAEKEYGLDYAEALEMSYENIQSSAKSAIKGIKFLD